VCELITKIKHPAVVEARDLSKSKNRLSHKKLQLRGLQQLKWAQNAGLFIETIFILCNDNPKNYAFNNIFYKVSEGIMKKITETNYLIPCVGIAKMRETETVKDFVIVLDQVQDHGNIGTIVRTGKAYGINHYIATHNDFDPYFTKLIDASRGTVFSADFHNYETPSSAILDLKEKGYQIIATSPYGKSLQNTLKLEEKPVALVVGNETNGVCEEIKVNADHLVQIPMYTEVESLNVGVATGISIYELRFKEVLAMLSKKIKETIGRKINITSQVIRTAFDKEIKKHFDVSGDQIIFLMVLKREIEMSEEQITRQFGYDKTEMNSFLQKLTNQNLVERLPEKKLKITQQGEELLSKSWPLHERFETLILNGITKAEEESFKDILKRIKNNCVEIIQQDKNNREG